MEQFEINVYVGILRLEISHRNFKIKFLYRSYLFMISLNFPIYILAHCFVWV